MSASQPMSSQSPDQRLRSLKTIAMTMLASPVMLGVVLLFTFAPEERFVVPPTWLLVAQLACAVAVFMLCEYLFYRTPAVQPGTDRDEAQRQGVGAYVSAFFLRVAVCEFVAIASVAAAFVVEPRSWLNYVAGGVLSVLLLVVHVLPTERTFAKTRASLEREGAHVPLF